MAKSLYLVNPTPEFPTYFGAEVHEHWGLQPAQSIADLTTTTVAALAPADWSITICDEHVEEIDFDVQADYIGITGKTTQVKRMIEVAREFRRRGQTVIIGGPFASLSPDPVRDECDILVVGELEGIAEEFFADLDRGDYKREYVGERPDITTSPIPRWDLYPNDRARMGCIQTSRGCPFECEFCDVIQYLGRKQRHKTIQQILAELDYQHELGYRQVFLADDNFTAYRKRAKQVLSALAEWNRAHADDPMAFSTQLSIDAAGDAEIVELLAQSGMTQIFIGIETPNEESLAETKKRQNLGGNMKQQIEVFLAAGIQVIGGMILGFDHDGPDIFGIQYDFAMSTPVPIFTMGALVAPPATPLHARMEKAGRLIEGGSEVAGSPLDTNIMPAILTLEQLQLGLRWLRNRLYRPEDFARRMVRMIEALGPQRGPFRRDRVRVREPRAVDADVVVILKKLIRLGVGERQMWSTVLSAMQAKPDTESMVMAALTNYSQVRCLYEVGNFWDPRVAECNTPFDSPGTTGPAERVAAVGA